MIGAAGDTLAILTMNVGSPSRKRAERQLEWLGRREEDVLVLTETSRGQGSNLLAARLSGAGWDVRYPLPDLGERGVLLASRARLAPRGRNFVDYLPPRVEAVAMAGGSPNIVGVYVPSRDASVTKTERKQRFITALAAALRARPASPSVLIGDLNIIEPDHRPRYPWFSDWEYALYAGLVADGWRDAYRLTHPTGMEHSWISHLGDGYRYDHVFVSAELSDRVGGCDYVHETREHGLTDHSAMTLTLFRTPAERLATIASLSADPPSLF